MRNKRKGWKGEPKLLICLSHLNRVEKSQKRLTVHRRDAGTLEEALTHTHSKKNYSKSKKASPYTEAPKCAAVTGSTSGIALRIAAFKASAAARIGCCGVGSCRWCLLCGIGERGAVLGT